MNQKRENPVTLIPVDEINVVNTRSRGKVKFKEIVASIAKLGLKKPITVTHAGGKYGGGKYDLVCGEGRLLAFRILGHTTIPARIQSVSAEDVLLMTLVENMARRQARTPELLGEIAAMKERGNTVAQIAAKTDLTNQYVTGVLRLISHGEHALITAVEKRLVPLSIAIEIATSDDKGVQKALHDAYEKNLLRGAKLMRVRDFIDKRRTAIHGHKPKTVDREALSARKMLQAYRDETARQQAVVKQAQLCQRNLLYVSSALKRLVADDNFINLLRAEALDSMPQYLAERVR
ncbi:MAG: ParB N-terminal domain-containing protein [Planctomycetes bacterium]|nr:ParB N-terminal domain-containing protein [Planctomycetota bacterium]